MSVPNTVQIPYFDLKRQYHLLQNEFEPALINTASSGAYVLTKTVEQFESAFADYCGSDFGIGVGSGTDALIFSLKALGIGKGDEVILPGFTFTATALSIIHAGATPVFAEVEPDTYTLDAASVKKLITSKTKALLPVHLYGQSANMDELGKIARKHRLKIVEDACQAHGAIWKTSRVGSLGDAGCFSFYPTKNLGAMGDGGIVLTDNPKLVEIIKKMRNLGRTDMRHPHTVIAWTSRLDGMQASVLQIKLNYLDDFNRERRRIAARYVNRLQGTPLIMPKEGKDRYHVYHLFVVRVPNKKRDALQQHLAQQGIQTMIHYPIPVYKQPAIKPFIKKAVKLPLTDQLCHEILSLPIFPEMSDEEVDRVCKSIQSFYRT